MTDELTIITKISEKKIKTLRTLSLQFLKSLQRLIPAIPSFHLTAVKKRNPLRHAQTGLLERVEQLQARFSIISWVRITPHPSDICSYHHCRSPWWFLVPAYLLTLSRCYLDFQMPECRWTSENFLCNLVKSSDVYKLKL